MHLREVMRTIAITVFTGAVLLARAHAGDDTAAWIKATTRTSCQNLLSNVSPPGTATGVVVASPSKDNPNYFFHWIRDAALTMDAVLQKYEQAETRAEREELRSRLIDYVDLSRQNQLYAPMSGEPKFEVDGRPYTGPWGRPQNDGPALRAVTLVRFAEQLLGEGAERYVRARLYDGQLPSLSVIKADLEFVAHRWRESSFDLWEEARGQHFYTRAVQRRALLDGARLAERLGDGGAARFYREQAQLIEVELLKHWDGSRGYIVATLEYEGGDRGKSSNLDAAVILGVLHGQVGTTDTFFSPTQERFLATAEKLRLSFERLYAINARKTDFAGEAIGTAIGRYPEDVYDGLQIGGKGNPWVLITNGFAEYCYRLASQYLHDGKARVTPLSLPFLNSMVPALGLKSGEVLVRGDTRFSTLLLGLREGGDGFLRRTRLHVHSSGSMAEQINRENGYMQGARDLTWSYAAFVTAALRRGLLTTSLESF